MKSIAQIKNFEWDYASLCDNHNKVRQYLDGKRHIDFGIIEFLAKNKLLFQEIETNNAVFPMYDKNNNIIGAELQGITEKRFTTIKEGSKCDYGFNVRFSENNIFDLALFFESAVDLLSFMDYRLYHEGKKLNRCILISMAGLKINVIKHTLETFCGDSQAVLCVNNDNTGHEFINQVERTGITYSLCLPDNQYRDWNEQVRTMKIESTVMGRLLKRQRDNLTL